MRVMVFSLLRLGDWLQSEALLRGLRERFQGEYSFVLQSVARSAEILKPQDSYFWFPREDLAREMVEEYGVPSLAKTQLNRWIKQLESWKPDVLLDLHPSDTSQPLIKYLSQGTKAKVWGYHPRWSQYLNRIWISSAHPLFAWQDMQARVLGLEPSEIKSEHQRSSGRTHRLAMQLFTSRDSKNWDVAKWRELIHLLQNQISLGRRFEIDVLCTSSERELILAQAPDLGSLLRVCDLREARELIQSSDLFVGADTAILHLAANSGTPLIGIYQGEANKWKMPPRLAGAWILELRPGSEPEIPSAGTKSEQVELVFRLIQAKLNGQKNLHSIGTQFSAIHWTLSEVGFGASNCVLLRNLFSMEGEQVNSLKMRTIDQVAWAFYLDGKYDELVPPFGSATQELMDRASFQTGDVDQLEETLEKLEDAEEIIGEMSDTLLKYCRQGHRSESIGEKLWAQLPRYGQELVRYPLCVDSSRRFMEAVENPKLSVESYFECSRRAKEGISEISILLQIKRKLVQSLITKVNERSRRVSRTRELSRTGY